MKEKVYWMGVIVCAILVIYLVVGVLMLSGHFGIKECGMDWLFLGITLFFLMTSIGFIILCDRI